MKNILDKTFKLFIFFSLIALPALAEFKSIVSESRPLSKIKEIKVVTYEATLDEYPHQNYFVTLVTHRQKSQDIVVFKEITHTASEAEKKHSDAEHFCVTYAYEKGLGHRVKSYGEIIL